MRFEKGLWSGFGKIPFHPLPYLLGVWINTKGILTGCFLGWISRVKWQSYCWGNKIQHKEEDVRGLLQKGIEDDQSSSCTVCSSNKIKIQWYSRSRLKFELFLPLLHTSSYRDYPAFFLNRKTSHTWSLGGILYNWWFWIAFARDH